jgi:hypothetical protein
LINKNIIEIFIASGGFPILALFLQNNKNEVQNDNITKKMIFRTLDLINEVLNLKSKNTDINEKINNSRFEGSKFTKDFCRLFSGTKFLHYLSELLINWNLNEKDEEYLKYHDKILDIFDIFSRSGKFI